MVGINGRRIYDVHEYEVSDKATGKVWYRNPLTGAVYKEKIPGKMVRYHVIVCTVDNTMHDWLVGLFEKKETVNLNTPKTTGDKQCIFTDDEFRFKKISGTEAYEGSVVLEEVQIRS